LPDHHRCNDAEAPPVPLNQGPFVSDHFVIFIRRRNQNVVLVDIDRLKDALDRMHAMRRDPCADRSWRRVHYS
jgi:hypothetical protein